MSENNKRGKLKQHIKKNRFLPSGDQTGESEEMVYFEAW
jgi:hypothetical protein